MDYDLIFIGGGRAGYEGAIAAAKKGIKTLVIEKDLLGGTCLQRGCIPTKTILHSVKAIKTIKESARIGITVNGFSVNVEEIHKRKARVLNKLTKAIELQFKTHAIEIKKGTARITAPNTVTIDGQQAVTGSHIVIASGSYPADLPFLRVDHQWILNSDDILQLTTVPDKLLVIGAGAVGLEWALIYAYLGSQVTVVEIMDQIMPGADREIAAILKTELQKQGVTIYTATTILNPAIGTRVQVTLKRGDKEWPEEYSHVLMAVGRLPNTATIATDDLQLTKDAKGFIKVDENLCTSIPGVFACGDVIGQPLLAHKASHQAIAIVGYIADGRAIEHLPIPGAVFTFPEMASIGFSEEEARKQGLAPLIGRFPYASGSRANAIEEKMGLVKVIAAEDGTIIGAHIVGAEAGELLPILTLAVQKRMKATDFRDLVCVHPTLSEQLWEALGDIGGFAIHI